MSALLRLALHVLFYLNGANIVQSYAARLRG